MNKPVLKILLIILTVLIIMSGFSYIYYQERDEIVKGESNINLTYRFYVTNEGPLNLTSISLRLALLKSWAPYQIVNSIRVMTQPNRTTDDEFTNKFAWYEYDKFDVGQSLDLIFDVNLTLNFMDYSTLDLTNIVYDKNSPEYRLYTAFDPLVDTTDPRISDVAQRFIADSNDYSALAFEAYNFTTSYLRYKLLSTSKGSSFAITNGYGDCDEYQNLFMALARSVGIPAIGHTAWLADFEPGFTTTDQGAVAHAFPMFYIPKYGLISADPTRGKDALFDNWMKTDNKRITMTQGPDQPYRLLNYKWIPVEGIANPTITSNYTVTINDMSTEYFSDIRKLIIYDIIIIPILFAIYNIYNGKKVRTNQQRILDNLLNPYDKST